MAVQRLSHVGICVSNLTRSLRFYRDLLGFRELTRLEVEGEPGDTLLGLEGVRLRAVYLERDGTRIELLHFSAPGTSGAGAPRAMNQVGLTHLSLRVDDLDATLAELARGGVPILRASRIDLPRVKTAAVFVTDPDGTRVELVQAPGDPGSTPGS
jgi:catechol 2,3-dioxygenase-like lactoylglutathione lyase family enzyme